MTSPSEPPKRADRCSLADETKSLIPNIIDGTSATSDSKKYTDLLTDPLYSIAGGSKARVTVRNLDTFTAAKRIRFANPFARIAVHNMASEKHAGGGWLRGALAQEEALCLRSTLSVTLHRRHYPLGTFSAIWSPRVAVFRDEVDSWCRTYDATEIFTVGVVSLAALRRPQLTSDGEHFRKFPLVKN